MPKATKWAEMSDDELALHCSVEMDECLEELVSRYEDRIRRCARRMAIDRDQAEDAVQETFLRLVASLPRFEGRSAFNTWLYRLAHNTCVDAFRRGARSGRHRAASSEDGDGPGIVLEELPAGWGSPEEELDRQIQECYLGWVLSGLPDDYREVIRLRLGEGRSTEEAAQLLGTTQDSVKAKLRRARQRLRETLRTARSCPYCGSMGSFRLGTSGEVE